MIPFLLRSRSTPNGLESIGEFVPYFLGFSDVQMSVFRRAGSRPRLSYGRRDVTRVP